MPDNEYVFRFVSKALTDTASFKKAKQDAGMLEGGLRIFETTLKEVSQGFTGLGESVGRNLTKMSEIMPISTRLASDLSGLGKELQDLAAASDLHEGSMRSLSAAMQQAEQAYKKGLIPVSAYRQITKQLGTAQKQLGVTTLEQLALSAKWNERLKEAKREVEELPGLLQKMEKEQARSGESSEEMSQKIKEMREQIKEAAADLSAIPPKLQKLSEEVEKQAATVGTLGGAWKALGEKVQGVGQWFKELPTQSLEAMKSIPEGMAKGFKERFLEPGLIKGIGRTLLRSLYMGPLAFVVGGRQRRGEGGAPLTGGPARPAGPGAGIGGLGGPGGIGGLIKSFGSLGGILKVSLGAIAPAALLLKALAPALKMLQHALEPIIAPFQEILVAVVQTLAPHLAELGEWLADLAKKIIPPLIKVIQMLVKYFKWWWGLLAKLFIPIIKKVGEVFLWLVDLITSIPIIGPAIKRVLGVPEKQKVSEHIFAKEKEEQRVRRGAIGRVRRRGEGGFADGRPIWPRPGRGADRRLLREQRQQITGSRLAMTEAYERLGRERMAEQFARRRATQPAERPAKPSAEEITRAQAIAVATDAEKPKVIIPEPLSPIKQSAPVVKKLGELPAEIARKLHEELRRTVLGMDVEIFPWLAEGGG